jgi:hypothetical protein
MTKKEIRLDFERESRLGFGEAALCAQKTVPQIEEILRQSDSAHVPFLLTRLDEGKHAALAPEWRERLDYHAPSRTAFFGYVGKSRSTPGVAVVTAGTSDAGPAHEALRTLEFNHIATTPIFDIGVAGIWRLMERVDEIARHPVVIAVAGMDAALPSVVGGLVPGAVIAVPTSAGYGMAREGETALNACLVSCAPGITVTNIDNGYGAACAAIRTLKAMQMVAERQGIAKAAE